MKPTSLSLNLPRLLIKLSVSLVIGFLLQQIFLDPLVDNATSSIFLREIGDLLGFFMLTAPIFYLAVYRETKQITARNQQYLDRYEKFETILEQSTAGAYIYGEKGFLYVNQTLCDLLGYEMHEIIGKTLVEVSFLKQEERRLLLENMAKRFSNQYAASTYSISLLRKDGKEIKVEINVSLASFQNGTVIIGSMMDVTEREKLEEELKQSESMYKQLFTHSLDLIVLYDLEGKIMEVNPAGVEQLGFESREDLLHKMFPAIVHPDDLPMATQVFEKAVSGKSSVFECRSIGENGLINTFSVNAMSYYQYGEIAGVFCLSRDISSEKEQRQTIEHLAYHDFLTELPNRRFFSEKMETTLKEAKTLDQKVALLFMDMDRVKAVNDNLGHGTGDELLKQVGARFQNALKGKGFLARIGGDEFAVILPVADSLTEVTYIANQLLLSLADPFVLNYHHIRVNTSIGIALYSDHGFDANSLLQAADTAMYQAKYFGGNQYRFYDAKLDTKNEEAFYLEHDLTLALHKQEFFLEYQPKVDAETEEVRAVEALVRWNHPEKGVLQPAKIIPVAEKTGLITRLGEWVLREACHQAKEWQEKGFPPIRVAVNVSAIQLKQVDVAQQIRDILRETGLEAKWLEIEITEGTLMEGDEMTTLSIAQLKAMGVYISLDDFGTGYSSMQYLKQFPLSALKIDRAFIMEVNKRPEQASITKAILQLGHGLGMHVLAEGVETEDELAYLQQLGIDELQGYLLSKPLTVNEFEVFLNEKIIKRF